MNNDVNNLLNKTQNFKYFSRRGIFTKNSIVTSAVEPRMSGIIGYPEIFHYSGVSTILMGFYYSITKS